MTISMFFSLNFSMGVNGVLCHRLLIKKKFCRWLLSSTLFSQYGKLFLLFNYICYIIDNYTVGAYTWPLIIIYIILIYIYIYIYLYF